MSLKLPNPSNEKMLKLTNFSKKTINAKLRISFWKRKSASIPLSKVRSPKIRLQLVLLIKT
jgi:hypothetical protein